MPKSIINNINIKVNSDDKKMKKDKKKKRRSKAKKDKVTKQEKPAFGNYQYPQPIVINPQQHDVDIIDLSIQEVSTDCIDVSYSDSFVQDL